MKKISYFKYRCFKLFVINQIKLYHTKNISTFITIIYFPFTCLSIIISIFILFLAISYIYSSKRKYCNYKKKLIQIKISKLKIKSQYLNLQEKRIKRSTLS